MYTPLKQIRYLRHHAINKPQWDRCITAAGNGLVYALSYFLDEVAGSWDALVLNDYEAVMPLTWKRKYGIMYLYQPYFAATLGVFGTQLPPGTTELFLEAIPQKFMYWDIDLNEANQSNSADKWQDGITYRVNYLLPLQSGYAHIRQGYKRLAGRMTKRALNSGMAVCHAIPQEVIAFYRQHYRHAHSGMPDGAYKNLQAAAQVAYKAGSAVAYLAKWQDGTVAAAYLILADDRFVYSVIGGSTEKGKAAGAFYLLTDAAIKHFAGSNRVFRFEGSDVAGIAFFNAQFGAQAVGYLHIRLNRLPFPLNLCKK